jgi:hypothetical protein
VLLVSRFVYLVMVKLIIEVATLSLIFPLQGAFPDDVSEPHKKKAYEHQHSKEPLETKALKVNRVWIKEDYFNVKQDKKYCNQEVLDAHWLSRISNVLDATFKVF